MVIKHNKKIYNVLFSIEEIQPPQLATPFALHALKITIVNPLEPSKKAELAVNYADIIKWQETHPPLKLSFPSLDNVTITLDASFLSQIQFFLDFLKKEYETSKEIRDFIKDFYQIQESETPKPEINFRNETIEDKEKIKNAFVSTVSVIQKQDGKLYYCKDSNNPSAQQRKYIITPFWVMVVKMCPQFVVYSEDGSREYRYCEPTEKALNYLAETFPSAVKDLERLSTPPTTNPFKP